VEKTCSPRPLVKNGEQAWIGKGPWTCSEKILKEKKGPTINSWNVDEDINL
jgi:hypothetical protein